MALNSLRSKLHILISTLHLSLISPRTALWLTFHFSFPWTFLNLNIVYSLSPLSARCFLLSMLLVLPVNYDYEDNFYYVLFSAFAFHFYRIKNNLRIHSCLINELSIMCCFKQTAHSNPNWRGAEGQGKLRAVTICLCMLFPGVSQR